MLRIAIRNVIQNRKRSLLVGSTIFISTLVLFLSDFTMNGVETQVIKGYINLQSGEVNVVGPELKGKRMSDPAKYFMTELPDQKERAARVAALPALDGMLSAMGDEIAYVDRRITRFGTITKGRVSERICTYNLTPEHRDHLLATKTIELKAGKLEVDEPGAITVSEDTARKAKLSVGDTVSLSIKSVYGAANLLDFTVRGIYKNRAGYDAWYGFMSDRDARLLLDADPSFFDVCMIFLKNPEAAKRVSEKLDSRLKDAGLPLGSDWWYSASLFYPRNAQGMKSMSAMFVYVMMIIIALGLRSSLRMNLFERMREFGTMRAMGFGRWSCYVVIFSEVFFLTMIAFAVALAIGIAYVAVFGTTGIYVGGGPMSYALGNESFWPQFKMMDVVSGFIVILVFSIFATVGPALRLNFQPITDTIAKRFKKISPLRELMAERRRRRLAKVARGARKTAEAVA
jgi:putative ABC transport system permease protein